MQYNILSQYDEYERRDKGRGEEMIKLLRLVSSKISHIHEYYRVLDVSGQTVLFQSSVMRFLAPNRKVFRFSLSIYIYNI